ncbi:MAG: hypothetical protein ACYDDB_04200 [bacterium]
MEKANVELKDGFYDLQDFLLGNLEDFIRAVEYSRNTDFKINRAKRIKKVSEILKKLKKEMRDGISIVDWQLKELGKEQETVQADIAEKEV